MDFTEKDKAILKQVNTQREKDLKVIIDVHESLQEQINRRFKHDIRVDKDFMAMSTRLENIIERLDDLEQKIAELQKRLDAQ